MRTATRIVAMAVGAALVAIPLIGAPVGGTIVLAKPAAGEPKLGPPSTAVTADILDAVAEEMNRGMLNLQIGKLKPYQISYKITEVDVNDVVASLGHTTFSKNRHFVSIEARVRVGSVDHDNGNFVIAGGESYDGVASFQLPLEATPRIARRAAWLVTDQAYKEAVIQLRAKNDARKSSGVTQTAPSWTTETPVVAEDPVLVPALETLEDLEKRAGTLSKVFRDKDIVRDSRVAFTSYLERRWYLNSDGTSVHDTRRVTGVLIAAVGQADDGQELAQYYTGYGNTAADLPDDNALLGQAKGLATTLAALAKAPMLQRYTGPVLFEGAGAAGIVRHTLAPHLGGTPLPEGLPPQEAKQFGGALTDKVGIKVTTGVLSIVDDPTATKVAGQALIGGYKIDDEGVPAQKVAVIKNGKLETLLTSRTPASKGETSNGHARRTAPGGMFHGTATNLIITGKGGVDRKKLVGKLLAAAKADGLDYGLIIKRFDDPAITAQPEMTRRELLAMFKNSDADLPPPAILTYKVYPGGKEELVRAGQLGEVPIRAWKDVIAVGKTPTVMNFLASADSYVIQKINTVAEGAVPSSGIESAVVTPDLLFRELDVMPFTAGKREAPAIPRPELGKE